MMNHRARLSRRDFLKLAAAAPLAVHSAVSPSNPAADDAAYFPAAGLYNHPSQSAPPPNILVVVFDALSANNMSIYGYPRQTTPNLERLAARSTVYHRHFSAGTFTSPGTASLLTGDYPWRHRALQMRSLPLEKYAGQNLFGLLPPAYHKFAYTQNPLAFALLNQARAHIHNLEKLPDIARLSQTFAEDWLYHDYYVASEAESLYLKEEYDQPASLFWSLLDRWLLNRRTRSLSAEIRREYPRGPVNCRTGNPSVFCYTLEDAIDWTIQTVQTAPRPFCGYIHVFPPHAPYNPRAEFAQLFDDDYQPVEKPEFAGEATHAKRTLTRYRRFYDQSIAHADAEFGRLMQALNASGVLSNTVVVLTSDHGEMLERGIWGHISASMYAPLVHIPMIVFPPKARRREDIYVPSSAVDLLPSLLKLSGAKPIECEGQVLTSGAAERHAGSRTLYVVDAKTNHRRGALTKASFAAVRWPWKLIRYSGQENIPDGYELYNIQEDPEELKNRFTADHPEGLELMEALRARLAQ